MTLMRAPFRVSSCISYFNRSKPASSSAIVPCSFVAELWTETHDCPTSRSAPAGLPTGAPTLPALSISPSTWRDRRPWSRPGDRVPRANPESQRASPFRAWQRRVASAMSHIPGNLRTAAGQNHAAQQRPLHPHARQLAPNILKQLARPRFNDLVQAAAAAARVTCLSPATAPPPGCCPRCIRKWRCHIPP